MPRRSLVFVVSDFISRPGWAEPLAHLAQRHEVVAVRLYDPLEMELPDLGLLVIQDAETGEQVFVDTHDKGFRKRFAAAGREARGGAAHRRSRRRGRRRARARDRRRPRRRDPALRRSAQAAQPARRGRRPAARTSGAADDIPLGRDAVAAGARAAAGRGLRLAAAPEEEDRRSATRASRWSRTRWAPASASAATCRRALFLVALALMIVAIARPAAVVTLPSQHETIILAMDVSGSMRAADVEPNRSPPRRRRPARSSTTSRSTRASASCRSPAPPPSCSRRRATAKTSSPPSTASSCSAAPRSAAASSSR